MKRERKAKTMSPWDKAEASLSRLLHARPMSRDQEIAYRIGFVDGHRAARRQAKKRVNHAVNNPGRSSK